MSAFPRLAASGPHYQSVQGNAASDRFVPRRDRARAVGLAEFHWQAGYGAFSISPSHVDALKEYILNQEEHHRRESFQDEFRRLCKKYGVEIDERYVWD